MRAYKKGFLDILGVVRTPIKLYSAVDKGISLSGMSMCCGSFVGYKKVCKKCGKELLAEDIGKGFWDGVTLNPVNKEMLEGIKLTTTENIEIKGFVDRIDPVLYSGKVYFLGINEVKDKQKNITPNWSARKDYMMLAQALKTAGRTGVGKTVLRNKEEIVAISEYQGGLILNVLYFPEQIRGCEEVYDLGVEVKGEELKNSVALVKSMNNIKLEEFRDKYTEQLQKLIAGEKIEVREIKKVEVDNGDKWAMALKMAKNG